MSPSIHINTLRVPENHHNGHPTTPRKMVDKLKEKIRNSALDRRARSRAGTGTGGLVVPQSSHCHGLRPRRSRGTNGSPSTDATLRPVHRTFRRSRAPSTEAACPPQAVAPDEFLDKRDYVSRPTDLAEEDDWLELVPAEHRERVKALPMQRIKTPSGRYMTALRTLGTGNFGRVFLVQDDYGNVGALKRYKKKQLIEKEQDRHIQEEARILGDLSHPFIVNLRGCFMDRTYIYMLMEYVPGGEFFFHIRNQRRLTERHSCFYAAQITLVFEYLHSMHIAYRDLKPENLLIDPNGYLKLTDFGFAKNILDKTYTLCGTPEYLAPEILMKSGHNQSVDWWTLGVLIYEMLVGNSPFGSDDSSVTDVYKAILSGNVNYEKNAFQSQCLDIIKKFLVAKPDERLGSGPNGSEDVKKHAWFTGLVWETLAEKRYSSPYSPQIGSASDAHHFEDFDENTDDGESIAKEADPFDAFQEVSHRRTIPND